MSDTPASRPDSAGQALPHTDKAGTSAKDGPGQNEPAFNNSAAAGRDRPSPRRSRGASLLLTLILLLLIGGLGASGWFHFEQRKTVAALRADLAALSQHNTVSPGQLAALQQQQQLMLTRLQEAESAQQQLQTALQQMDAGLQQAIRQEQQSAAQALQESQQTSEQALQAGTRALQEANTRIAAQAEQLDGIRRELVATNLRVSDSGAGASQAWMLSEAESLLRLARQRLLVARDAGSAIGLFIAADDLLEQLNDPSVSAVRELLAQELATLQALPEVNVQDIYVQLGVQIERIDGLAIARESDNQDFTVPPAEDRGIVGAAGDWLNSVQNVLGRYFIVTQREATITPQLTGEQAYLLRRSMQLQIEQARLALLRGQTDIYRQALNEAINGITARLQDVTGDRDTLIATLATLRDTPISVDIPPLNATLAAIQQIAPRAADTPVEGNL